MNLIIKRNHIIIVPESDQDKSFLEDSLKLTENGKEIKCSRIDDVACGFQNNSSYVIKIGS